MRDIFKWEYVGYFFPRLLEALPVTLMIVIVATLIGTILGLITALIRVEKVPVLNPISAMIVSFLRGTPIYVQLFIVYFGIPVLAQLVGIAGLQVDRMAAVYAAYGLNVGAFFLEEARKAVAVLKEVATYPAQANRCKVTFREMDGKQYVEPVINDPELAQPAQNIVVKNFGEDVLVEDET